MNNDFDKVINKYTNKLCRYKMQILNGFEEKKNASIIKKFEKLFYGKIEAIKEENSDLYRISNKRFFWIDFIDDIANGLIPKFRNLKLLFELEYNSDILYICFLSPKQMFCIEIEHGMFPKYYYKNLDK